jgi:sec-independent protein translocase protein TatA
MELMTTGLLLFLNIGTSEMMLILFVALFLFGGKKLPELARGLGRGIREFKDASETIKRDISDQINNFEDDIKDVKSDIKSIAETSVDQDDPYKPYTESNTSASEPVNTDHQAEIDHSDQYYNNYDYPEETTVDGTAPEPLNSDPAVNEDNIDDNPKQ